MDSLTAYSGLAAAAQLRGHALALGLCFAARTLDAVGEGRVAAAVLKAEATRFMSPETYKRALRDGKRIGLFYRLTRRRDGLKMIGLRSLLNVARLLNVPGVGVPVTISAYALTSAKEMKAALYTAALAAHGTAPISRATLRDQTGIGRQTQRRHERNAGVVVTRNAKVVGTATPDAIRGVLEWHRDHTHGACRVDGNLILRPLPNSYACGLPIGSRAKARKVNRALRGRGLVHISLPGSKTFYANAQAATRAARSERAAGLPLTHYQGQVPPGWRAGGGLWQDVPGVRAVDRRLDPGPAPKHWDTFPGGFDLGDSRSWRWS